MLTHIYCPSHTYLLSFTHLFPSLFPLHTHIHILIHTLPLTLTLSFLHSHCLPHSHSKSHCLLSLHSFTCASSFTPTMNHANIPTLAHSLLPQAKRASQTFPFTIKHPPPYIAHLPLPSMLWGICSRGLPAPLPGLSWVMYFALRGTSASPPFLHSYPLLTLKTCPKIAEDTPQRPISISNVLPHSQRISP